MMKFLSLLITLCSFATQAVALDFQQAYEPIPNMTQALAESRVEVFEKELAGFPASGTQIVGTKIKILGRLIQNRRKTNRKNESNAQDSIGIGCIGVPEVGQEASGPSCDVLRHIYFEHKSGKAYYWGPIIIVRTPGDALSSDKAIRKKLREIRHVYRDYAKSQNKGKRMGISIGLSAAVLGGAAAIIMTVPIVGALAVVAFILVYAAVLVTAAMIGNELPWTGAEMVHTNEIFFDHDHWNWSINPHQVGRVFFNQYTNFAQSANFSIPPPPSPEELVRRMNSAGY